MGFRQADSEKRGGYAKVWKVEDKGNYSVGQLSTRRKKPGSDKEWEVDFQDGFVRFIGAAHTAIQNAHINPENGLSIQITSCDVSNKYDKASNKTYVNYAIFAFDVVDSNGGGNSSKTASTKKSNGKAKLAEVDTTDDLDDDLPF